MSAHKQFVPQIVKHYRFNSWTKGPETKTEKKSFKKFSFIAACWLVAHFQGKRMLQQVLKPREQSQRWKCYLMCGHWVPVRQDPAVRFYVT